MGPFRLILPSDSYESQGAKCDDGSCALRQADQTCVGAPDPIPGTWVVIPETGKYSLVSFSLPLLFLGMSLQMLINEFS